MVWGLGFEVWGVGFRVQKLKPYPKRPQKGIQGLLVLMHCACKQGLPQEVPLRILQSCRKLRVRQRINLHAIQDVV